MSSNYRFADGFNNAGSATKLSKQPRATRYTHGRHTLAGDAQVYVDGDPATELAFTFLTSAELEDIDTTLGVSRTVPSNDGTLWLPNEYDRKNDSDYTAYNVTVYRPAEMLYERGIYRDITYNVRIHGTAS